MNPHKLQDNIDNNEFIPRHKLSVQSSSLLTAAGNNVAPSTNVVGSACVVFTGFALFVSAIGMLLLLIIGHRCFNYYFLSIYEIVIIIHYGGPFVKYLKSDNKQKKSNNKKKWYSIVYGYWFHCKIVLCVSFSMIMAVLLLMNIHQNKHDHCSYIEPISYILGAFSIPLPLICLRLHANEEKRKLIELQVNCTQRGSVWTSNTSTLTTLYYLKPLTEGGIRFCTSLAYISHLMCYILEPILHYNLFEESINKIYDDKPSILYIVNQLLFRSFVGTVLVDTIFSFLYVLFNPKLQFVDNYKQIIKHLFETDKKWIYYALAILITMMMSADVVQLSSGRVLNLSIIEINLTFHYDDYLCLTINGIWCFIHLIVIGICLMYTMNFHAIPKKHKPKESVFNIASILSINQSTFATEATILIILFSLNVTFLYTNRASAGIYSTYNIGRQVFISCFMVVEGSSLYFLMSLSQEWMTESFRKNNWRANGLLSGYFRFIIIVNVYDFIYLAAFKMVYFHQNGLTKTTRLSYAFSFSSLTLIMLFIRQLIKSYGIWKELIIDMDPSIHSAGSGGISLTQSQKGKLKRKRSQNKYGNKFNKQSLLLHDELYDDNIEFKEIIPIPIDEESSTLNSSIVVHQ